jgi:MFS family permease
MLERRWFILLLIHAFLLQAIILVLRIGMTYDAVSIGLDALWVGLIGGAFGAVPALLGLYTGRFIDRLGERVALVVGSVLALIAAAGLLLVPPSAASLVVFSTFAGLSMFVCIASQHSATGKTDRAGQAANFGHLTTVISIAHAIGPIVFGALANRQALPDTGPVFLLATVASVAMLVLAPLLRIPRSTPPPEARGMLRVAGAILRTRGFLPATLASLMLFSAMDLLVIYLPLYGTEHGISAGAVGVLLSLRGAASVISRFFFGLLFRVMGRGPLLVTALLVAGCAIALLPFAGSLAAMAVLAFVAGLGLGIGAPLSLAWISEIIDRGVLGSALSLRLAINRSGQVLLPIAVGAVATGLGASAVLFAIGGSLLVTSGASAILARRQ